jgi:hypothetical protein
MATKINKDFLQAVEEELSKLKEGFRLAADVGKDYIVDKMVGLSPQAAILASGKMEQGRRFLQQGTVPGASKALAQARAQNPTAGKALARLRNAPSTQAAIELGKATYLIGKEGARAGHAEAGRELIKKPLAYQVANILVSPADAMSKYGASREELGKKSFEEDYINSLNRKIAEKEEEDMRNNDVPIIDIRKGAQPNARKFFK